MIKAAIRPVSRQERPEPAGLGMKSVKIFLDNGGGRRYSPRFNPEIPTPRG